MKKKLTVILVVLSMVMSLLVPSAMAFSDTKGHWAEQAITRWENAGVIGGYEDGQFRPDQALTRGELAAMISTIFHLSQTAANRYPDLPSGEWYTPYMLRCVAAGFLAGTDTGAEPLAMVNREQAAVIFARAFMIPEETSSDTGFFDQWQISDWARPFVRAMKNQKMIAGIGGNLYAPKQPLTRAQAVTILNAAIAQYVDEENAQITPAQNGITMITASGVTVTGNADTVLVTPGATNGKITFQNSTVSGELRVEAANLELVIGENSSVPNRRWMSGIGTGSQDPKAYSFRYNCEEKDYNGTIYYTDDYFKPSADRSRPDVSLASASIHLAVASFNAMDSAEYTDKDRNVRNLLTMLGYSDYDCSESFHQKPSDDSIAIAAAAKKPAGADYTLMAVAVRGGGYEAEWSGNFSLGKVGNHTDFQQCADYCMTFLRQYVQDHHITGRVKLWLTGYSRGGAVGNIMAGEIDRGNALPGLTVRYEDLYAYFFEPPQGVEVSNDPRNARYNNIWNFLNYNDVVPLVAMSELGFSRYGRDYYYPDATMANYAAQREDMLHFYDAQESKEFREYTVDDFQMKKFDPANGFIVDDTESTMTQGDFERKLVSKMVTDTIKTRDNYVNEYQNGFRAVMHVVFGKSLLTGREGDVERFITALQKNIQEQDTAAQFAEAAQNPWDENGLRTVLSDVIVQSMNDAEVNALDPVTLSKFVNGAVKLVGGMLITDPDLTVTLLSNLNNITNAHYPEVGMAWLKTMDPNYSANPYPLPH